MKLYNKAKKQIALKGFKSALLDFESAFLGEELELSIKKLQDLVKQLKKTKKDESVVTAIVELYWEELYGYEQSCKDEIIVGAIYKINIAKEILVNL